MDFLIKRRKYLKMEFPVNNKNYDIDIGMAGLRWNSYLTSEGLHMRNAVQGGNFLPTQNFLRNEGRKVWLSCANWLLSSSPALYTTWPQFMSVLLIYSEIFYRFFITKFLFRLYFEWVTNNSWWNVQEGKKKNGHFWALKYDFVNLKCLRMLKKRAL